MKSKQSAHYMGNTNVSGFRLAPSVIVIILLMTNISILVNSNNGQSIELGEDSDFFVSSKASSGDVDAPSWRVGDSWVYSGFFDVAALIASSGQSSNVQTLTGDLTMWVSDIVTVTTENQSTLAYVVRSSGLFEANGVSLSGYSGDIDVDYDGTDYIRVSDLATISMQMNLLVEFTAFGFINIEVADLQVINSYSPPREEYDFPLRVGEAWSNNYTQTTDWSGSSDYFDIPDDSTSQTSSNHAIVAQGNPNVPYSGCGSSYNVTTFDSSGQNVTSYRWWCPNAKNDALRNFQDDIGFDINFKLKTVNLVSRSKILDVELENPAWILDSPQGAWVNVTDSSGSPIANQALQWRYEANGVSYSLTTASNGSAYVDFDTGNATDPSPTNFDWASHGIMAWIASTKEVGVDTLTLDDSIVTLDYRPNSGGVSVERTRDGTSVMLNPTIGFNAVPGDSLIFSIPVENLGILQGPATELAVTGPDGSTSRASVAAISALGTGWVQASWNVPSTQQIGTVTISFEVDPDGLMVGDQNQSNDIDTFDIFIGSLPTADLIQPQQTKTLTNIHIDARNSFDLDGGSPHCTFVVETSHTENETFEEEDCLLENRSWSDDGTYRVWLTITDDENDQDSVYVDVEIQNRAPWVNVSTQNSVMEIEVESSVTFFATDSGDLDTLNSQAPVDFIWQLPNRPDGTPYLCEGENAVQVAPTCKVTPMTEGMFTPQVIVEDDDGATTTGLFNLLVTNIAPTNPQITMWNGSEEMISETNPPKWYVYEDQKVSLKGTAYDSLNDMDTLTWGWQHDVGIDPNNFTQTIGAVSEIEVWWETKGIHSISMEVVDDNGLSSGFATATVEVINVPPTVEQIPPQPDVGEDDEITLIGIYSDTDSDIEDLTVCWDVDFTVDLDLNGNNMDDCDFVGAVMTYHWTDPGEKNLVFHVTDDDGDKAEAYANITVKNKRPKAAATPEKLTVTVGEELVIWTNETTDSPSDMPNLRFFWDFDTTDDDDDDGDTTNDINARTATDEPLRHVFTSPGTKNIRLSVLDEGDTASTVDIVITVVPDDSGLGGWINANTAGVSNVVVILGLVLVGLLMVLGISMARNKDRPTDEWIASTGAIFTDSSPTVAPPTYAFEAAPAAAPAAAPVQPATPVTEQPQPVTGQLFAPEAVQQPVNEVQPQLDAASLDSVFGSTPSGPPVPAAGLPEGWTMEQWNHYGAQWLKDQEELNVSTPPGFDFDL